MRGCRFKLRGFLYRNLEPSAQAEGGLSHFNRVIVWLIIFASVVAILKTEDTLRGAMSGAFWWSIATLTTVGYGDVTPVTVLGRIFAGFTAIAGIGLIAMPTGILAAAFSEAMRKRNELAKNENDVKEDL